MLAQCSAGGNLFNMNAIIAMPVVNGTSHTERQSGVVVTKDACTTQGLDNISL